MTTELKSVVVITVSGEIDLDNQDELEESVLERLATGSVVLDCSALDFLSISALRSLDVCAAAAELSGHDFVLAHPAPHVARLLRTAGLDHLQQPPAQDLTGPQLSGPRRSGRRARPAPQQPAAASRSSSC